MEEIKYPNDIFVTTLLNPQSTTNDLIRSGLDTSNTGLLTKEQYKETPFVKKQFTDDKGVFDDASFEKAYMAAYDKYARLDTVKSFDDLNGDITYNSRSVFRPIDGKMRTPSYELMRVRNPFDTSKGVESIYGEGNTNKSMREIAQTSKVFDVETNKWLDYTAEDQGFLGLKYLGRPTLVYATWDKDGTHYDEYLGREVTHRKGEWKTNADGKFYCETLGDRESYDKQVVAYSDILTKEDSWMNNIDFFDSDGKDKSITGTVAKTVAQIVPYVTPWSMFFGSVSAAVNLASVLPTFYKMFEGIVTGDTETKTGMFKAANALEGYMRKFDASYSDDAQQSGWDLEQMGNMVADVFGQIYQMKAMAGLSEIAKSTSLTKEQEQRIGKYLADHVDDMAEAMRGGFIKDKNAFIKKVIYSSPEFKDIAKSQSQLAKKFSLGYMALTSTSDVYSDALAGGYDRRTAGLAGLTAAVGQYALMMNNELGTWFLDKGFGYNENVSRNVLKQAIRPEYEKLKLASLGLATKEGKEAAKKTLGGVFKRVGQFGNTVWDAIKYGNVETILGNAGIEAIEEVTEEAVMDATKGVFDALSAMGFAGMHGSFGGFDNVFSKQGLERYLTSFVGGAVGGALFKVNDLYLQPFMSGQIMTPDVQYSLIHEIANGNTLELINTVMDLTNHDTSLSRNVMTVDGQEVASTKDSGISQSKFVREGLIKYIQDLDAIINGSELGKSDEEVAARAIRSELVMQAVKDAGVEEIILSDYNKQIKRLIDAKHKLDEITSKEEPKDETKKKERKQEISKYEKEVEEATKQVESILNGDRSEYYLKASFALLTPTIKNTFLENMDKYSYAKAVYGKDYKELKDKGDFSKESVDKEYKDYINAKQAKTEVDKLVKLYDLYETTFSKTMKDYAESTYAKDVRKKTFDKALSKFVTSFASGIGNKSGGMLRDILANISLIAQENGLSSISLNDLMQIEPEHVAKMIIPSIVGFEQTTEQLGKIFGKPATEIADMFTSSLAEQLSRLPVLELNSEQINNLLVSIKMEFAKLYYRILLEKAQKEGKAVNKAFIDENLIADGFTTGEEIEEDTTNSDDLAKYLITHFDIAGSQGIDSVNLSQQVLISYLNSLDKIDNELLLQLKSNIINFTRTLFNTGNKAIRRVTILEEDGDSIQICRFDDFKDTLLQSIIQGINFGTPIETIINNWIDLKLQEYFLDKDVVELNEMVKEDLRSTLLSLFNTPEVLAYNVASTKEIQNNPLFDLMRKLSFQISGDGLDVKIFDLLQQEQSYIETLGSTDLYTRQGFTFEKIKNARKVINYARAIVAGMETRAVDSFGNLFGINQQINYFHKQYGGELKGEYAEIDQDMRVQLDKELDIMDEKLNFLQSLIEGNAVSQLEEDHLAEEAFDNSLIEAFQSYEDFEIDGKPLISKATLLKLKDQNLSTKEKKYLVEKDIYENGQIIIDEGNGEKLIQALIDKYTYTDDNDEIHGPKSIREESEGINKDVKTITYDDLFHYMLLSLSLNPDEFHTKLSQVLSKQIQRNAEKAKVPFFALEVAIKYALGFFNQWHNPKGNNIYKIATDLLNKNNPNPTITDYGILFINGITGAGKTALVLKNALEIIKLEFPNIRINLIAPEQRQVDTLFNAVTNDFTNEEVEEFKKNSTTKDKHSFFKEVFNVSKINEVKEALALGENVSEYFDIVQDVPKLKLEKYKDFLASKFNPKAYSGSIIVIDEITHFDAFELQLIAKFCKDNNIVLFTAGDTLQLGSSLRVNGGTMSHNIDDFKTVYTPKLRSSRRTLNIAKYENNQRFFEKVSLWERNTRLGEPATKEEYTAFVKDLFSNNVGEIIGIESQYHQSENRFEGDKFVDSVAIENKESFDAFVEDLRNIKRAYEERKKINPQSKIGILTEIQDGHILSKDLTEALRLAGIKEEDVKLYSQQNVQGAEEDFFIVSNIKWSNDLPLLYKQLYTYTSRSLLGTLVSLPNEIKSLAKITNLKLENNQEYQLPTSAKAQEAIQERIAFVEQLLKDSSYKYTPDLKDTYKPVTQGNASVEDINEQDEKFADDIDHDPVDIGSAQIMDERDIELDKNYRTQLQDEDEEDSLPIDGMDKDDSQVIAYGFNDVFSFNMDSTSMKDFISGTHFNLDDFFSQTYFPEDKFPEGPKDRKSFYQGFINFKHLLLCYNFSKASQDLKTALSEDIDVSNFCYVLFGTRDVDAIIKAIGDAQANPVIMAEMYNKNYHRSYTAFDYNEKDNDQKILLSYGIKIKDVSGKHRYISIASLAKLETVRKHFPDSTLLENLERYYEIAERELTAQNTKGRRAVVFKYTEPQTAQTQLLSALQNLDDINNYVNFLSRGQVLRFKGKDAKLSVKELIDRCKYNITNMWFISSKKEEDVNGEYLFLKFLESKGLRPESVPMEEWRKHFLDNEGRLRPRGKYIMRVAPSNSQAEEFARYIIVDQTPADALEVITKVRKAYSQVLSSQVFQTDTYYLISPQSGMKLVADVLGNNALFKEDSSDKAETILKRKKAFLEGWKQNIIKNNHDKAEENVINVIDALLNMTDLSQKAVYNKLLEITSDNKKTISRAFGISFAQEGIITSSNGKMRLAFKSSAKEACKWGWLKDDKGNSRISTKIYAGFSLHGNQVDPNTGLVPFTAWQNNTDIQEHLVSSHGYEVPKITIDVSKEIVLDTEYLEEKETYDDGVLTKKLYERHKQDPLQVEPVYINMDQYVGLVTVQPGEIIKVATKADATSYRVKSIQMNGAEAEYFLEDINDITHHISVNAKDFNKRLLNGRYKRFADNSTGNVAKFQSGTIFEFTSTYEKDGETKKAKHYGMIVGIKNGHYAYVKLSEDNHQPLTTVYYRSIEDAENADNKDTVFKPVSPDFKFKTTKKNKRKALRVGGLALWNGNTKKSKLKRGTTIVKIKSINSKEGKAVIQVQMKKKGKTTYGSEFTVALSKLYSTSKAKDKVYEVPISKIKFSTENLEKVLENVEKGKISDSNGLDELIIDSNFTGQAIEDEGDFFYVGIGTNSSSTEVNETVTDVTEGVEESKEEPTSPVNTIITALSTDVRIDAGLEAANTLTRVEGRNFKPDQGFDYDNNSYFVVPVTSVPTNIDEGLSKEQLLMAALYIENSNQELQNGSIKDTLYAYKAADLIILEFNGHFDNLAQAIVENVDLESSIIPVTNIKQIVNTKELYDNYVTVHGAAPIVANPLTIEEDVLTDPLTGAQSVIVTDNTNTTMPSISREAMEATLPTEESSSPADVEIQKNKADVEIYLQDYDITLDQLSEICKPGQFAFWVNEDGDLMYDESKLDPTSDLKDEIIQSLTNC